MSGFMIVSCGLPLAALVLTKITDRSNLGYKVFLRSGRDKIMRHSYQSVTNFAFSLLSVSRSPTPTLLRGGYTTCCLCSPAGGIQLPTLRDGQAEPRTTILLRNLVARLQPRSLAARHTFPAS